MGGGEVGSHKVGISTDSAQGFSSKFPIVILDHVEKKSVAALVTGGKAINKLDKPAGEHGLGMHASRNWLNQEAVSGKRNSEDVSNSDIPGLEDSVHIRRVQVPNVASIKATAVDVDQFHENTWSHKVKILQKRIDLAYEFSSFHSNVMLHGIVTLKQISQMLNFPYPGERVTIQDNCY